MKLRHLLTIVAASLLLGGCGSSESDGGGGTPAAKNPTYKNVVVTDDKETKTPKDSFATDTAKIFVVFDLENIGSGNKLKSVWIAEKAEGAPDNYKIDEASLATTAGMNVGDFSLSKPNNGWPVGSYKVEMYIDDKLSDTAKFTVK